MLDTLRKPLFVFSLISMACVVLVELGSRFIVGTVNTNMPKPGLGITYMVMVDGIVLYLVVLMAIALLVPERFYGKIQGVITLLFSLLMLIGSIIMIFLALALLVLMLGLLLAIPFGTAVYFAIYASFNTATASQTLGLIMMLKFLFAVLLVFSHQRFLQSKSLVLIILTSLVLGILLNFLYNIVPGFLVSITDAIGAIIIGVLAAIWSLFLLIGAIPAIVKAVRVDRALA